MLTTLTNKNSSGKKGTEDHLFLLLLPSANNALGYLVMLYTEGKNDYRQKHEIF